MGEARRKRLALIKGGKAEEAKKPEHNLPPQNLVQITVLVKKMLADVINNRYNKKVNHAAVPSRNAWIERLLVAGITSFDEEERKQAAEHNLVKLAGPKEMAQVAGEVKLT